MPKVLTEEQIAFYHDNGYLAPFDGVDPAEAAAMCADLHVFEREEGMRASEIIVKGHLCFRRSYEFSRHPKILDVVEDLIGPNIYALSSRFWMKPGRDGSYVSWHQDSAYFGLEPNELVTVWLALTDSTPENGCVRVIPGTHTGKIYSHVETFDKKNLLARGQTIDEIDDGVAADLVLKAHRSSVLLFSGACAFDYRKTTGVACARGRRTRALGCRPCTQGGSRCGRLCPCKGRRRTLCRSAIRPGSDQRRRDDLIGTKPEFNMASLVKDEPSGLNALTASEAASRIAAGEITSERLVGDCLDRIGAHDDTLHAWTYVDADHALAQARACDAADTPVGPLHGVPVGVKDVLDTRDMPTEYGSDIYAG
ncbi:MAG: hypothetical protein EBU57_01250, partial [Alphaproteobacteria bacterium]|nr:hypothetical protein [Alphaproteobacteria bacterium]